MTRLRQHTRDVWELDFRSDFGRRAPKLLAVAAGTGRPIGIVFWGENVTSTDSGEDLVDALHSALTAIRRDIQRRVDGLQVLAKTLRLAGGRTSEELQDEIFTPEFLYRNQAAIRDARVQQRYFYNLLAAAERECATLLVSGNAASREGS